MSSSTKIRIPALHKYNASTGFVTTSNNINTGSNSLTSNSVERTLNKLLDSINKIKEIETENLKRNKDKSAPRNTVSRNRSSHSIFDYDHTYSHGSSSGFGQSIRSIGNTATRAVDKAASGFLPSTLLSVATGGALNPVIIRALWGPIKEVGSLLHDTIGLIFKVISVPFELLGSFLKTGQKMGKGIVKGFSDLLFPGKSGGKYGLQGESQTIKNAKNSPVQSRLDKIIDLLGLKSKKGKSDKGSTGTSWKDIISKILMTVGLLGAAALAFMPELRKNAAKWLEDFLSGKLGMTKEMAGFTTQLIKDALPGMVVGYMIGGLPGALLGGAATAIYSNFDELKRRFTELLNTPDKNEVPQEGNPTGMTRSQLIGLVAGGALGLKFGGIAGALIGGSLGYIGGTIYDFKQKLEEEYAKTGIEPTWSNAVVAAWNDTALADKIVTAAALGLGLGGAKGALIAAGITYISDKMISTKAKLDEAAELAGQDKATWPDVILKVFKDASLTEKALAGAILGLNWGAKGALLGASFAVGSEALLKLKDTWDAAHDEKGNFSFEKLGEQLEGGIDRTTYIEAACLGFSLMGIKGALVGAGIVGVVDLGSRMANAVENLFNGEYSFEDIANVTSTIIDYAPIMGACLGLKYGGIKGAILGGLFSLGGVAIKNLGTTLGTAWAKFLNNDLSFGDISELLNGSIKDTAIIGACIGLRYGGIRGAIFGSLIGGASTALTSLGTDLVQFAKDMYDGKIKFNMESIQELLGRHVLGSTIIGACIGLRYGGPIGAVLGAVLGGGTTLAVVHWDTIANAFNSFVDTLYETIAGIKQAWARGGFKGVWNYMFGSDKDLSRSFTQSDRAHLDELFRKTNLGGIVDQYFYTDEFGIVLRKADGSFENINDDLYDQTKITRWVEDFNSLKTRKKDGYIIADTDGKVFQHLLTIEGEDLIPTILENNPEFKVQRNNTSLNTQAVEIRQDDTSLNTPVNQEELALTIANEGSSQDDKNLARRANNSTVNMDANLAEYLKLNYDMQTQIVNVLKDKKEINNTYVYETPDDSYAMHLV